MRNTWPRNGRNDRSLQSMARRRQPVRVASADSTVFVGILRVWGLGTELTVYKNIARTIGFVSILTLLHSVYLGGVWSLGHRDNLVPNVTDNDRGNR